MDDPRRQRLQTFVDWARQLAGDEKGEAQVFLDRMLQGFGHAGFKEAGATLEMRVRSRDRKGTAFADLVWKPYVLIEMKKRGEDLTRHYRQAFDYWTHLVPNRPRYVILCNFDDFWVYDFETQMDVPVDQVALTDLPTRYDPLTFLFPSHQPPKFGNHHEKVTRQAADRLATCFNKLMVRHVDRAEAQRFILQMLVAFFAEDIGLLPHSLVARLLDDCKTPEDCYDLLGSLFKAMNTPGGVTGGRFKGVDYFNGGLFAEPARLELRPDEVAQLQTAADYNWSKVRPEIFGTIFEHSLGSEERRAFGCHFTHPTDIMKIVGPTIVRPWTELIENATTLRQLERLRDRMQRYTVLDPACGSGNFLYLAYRELKRLEARLLERFGELQKGSKGQRQIGFVTARQFYGIDINPFAIEIAKVTMMIARKLAIDELGIDEHPLPLDNLDANFTAGDALIEPQRANGSLVRVTLFAEFDADPWISGHAVPTPWPRADVIIGNPPFAGAKRLKPERGASYVNAVRKVYPAVPGMADYCVYWFRKAHDHLRTCTPDDPVAGRAGLVGTQNIRNNQSRVGGLDYIVRSGTIVEAVENQPWSGEANVHVSIVNWVKHGTALAKTKGKQRRRHSLNRADLLISPERPLWYRVNGDSNPPLDAEDTTENGHPTRRDKRYQLAFRTCKNITSSLSDRSDVAGALALSCNQKPQRAFQGFTPGYAGFVLRPDASRAILERSPGERVLIRPYLIGRELVSGTGKPLRLIIDANDENGLTLARYPLVYAHLKKHVLPEVKAKLKHEEEQNSDMVDARREHVGRWWTFWARRDELRGWMKQHRRILASSRTQRLPFVFQFVSTDIAVGDKLQLFAFDDDYAFGITQSGAHCAWYERKAARLKNEADYNYSSVSVFETFPWPQSPTKRQINAVAAAGRDIRRVRAEILPKITGGLRALYRTLELPGKNPLKDAHAALDEAVLDAYGFAAPSPKSKIENPKSDDLLTQLLALNLEVAARLDRGEPVTAPGIPPTYGDPALLITTDCIQP